MQSHVGPKQTPYGFVCFAGFCLRIAFPETGAKNCLLAEQRWPAGVPNHAGCCTKTGMLRAGETPTSKTAMVTRFDPSKAAQHPGPKTVRTADLLQV